MVAAHAGVDHHRMVRNTSLIALAGLACAFAAGCGDDAAREPAQTKPRPAKVNLERFLLQPGEEPGYKPIESPRVESALEFGLPAAEAQQLRRSGYVSTTTQPISAENGNAGVIHVDLFKTEAGAQAFMEYATSTKGIRDQIPGAKIRRFSVPGVPGARGWTGRDVHGHPIGHVFWVQGRCLLVIGNEGSGPFAAPLSTGALAIYRRTCGQCP
jgi:hypothetical protein